jgi:hypothetical protein
MGPPPTSGTAIEAGCSFNGLELKGEPGDTFQVSCPANCENTGSVWGSEYYTRDSAVCRAGIHAGAIAPTGGVVTVRLEPGQPAYRGRALHGIQSGDFGGFHGSFVVVGGDGGAAPPAVGVVEAGCSFNGLQIVGEVGSRHVISCPPGCAANGSVWGTDVYTADSAVCRAAIHAGLIGDAGGTIALVLDPGRSAYSGSPRNGISSGDFAQFHKSYHLSAP